MGGGYLPLSPLPWRAPFRPPAHHTPRTQRQALRVLCPAFQASAMGNGVPPFTCSMAKREETFFSGAAAINRR